MVTMHETLNEKLNSLIVFGENGLIRLHCSLMFLGEVPVEAVNSEVKVNKLRKYLQINLLQFIILF